MKYLDRICGFACIVVFAATANAQASISGGGSLIPLSGSGGDAAVVGDGGATYDTVQPGLEAVSTVVSGIPIGSVHSIEIDGLTHTWVGDTQATLEDPNGIEHLIWIRPGYLNTSQFGSSADLDGGDYTFVGDGSGMDLPTSSSAASVPAGTYNQTFSTGGTTWVSGTNGIYNTPLGSIEGPAGVWTLHIYDWAGGDSGGFAGWTLNFGPGGGGAVGDGQNLAIRGTGVGVLYEWSIKETSGGAEVSSGSLATVLDDTADQMRTQLVTSIHDSVGDLWSTSDGWIPGGNWSPFQIGYSDANGNIPIDLYIWACNVSSAPLSSPCSFNPEIASAIEPNVGGAYCFGDGSGASCPCGALSPTESGCLTSSGSGVTLVATGNAVVMNDSFTLSVSGGPANRPGIFFQGPNVFSNPAGDGILCSNASLRYGVNMLDGTGSTTQTGFGINATASETLNYQYWFRDPSGACGGGYNFSNGWTVTWL